MYNQTISDILVFKTNVQHKADLEKVADALKNEPRISKWNIDYLDVDKVLRIESDHLTADDIVKLVVSAGFWCEELPD